MEAQHMARAIDGQVAIITGGARGQGRADAVALAELGARVVVCDVPAPMTSVRYELGTAADLELTASLVREAGGEAIAFPADVRDPAAVARVAGAALAEFGQVDILVANAGIVSTGQLWELSDEAWQEMIGTNLTGVFNAMRVVVPPRLGPECASALTDRGYAAGKTAEGGKLCAARKGGAREDRSAHAGRTS
jgi:NAD(P)-dependent dehydrogenase (short-subunit alcohol dehydrogenase family)